jgi:hypothetical protein
MEITIKEILIPTLETIASENDLTPEEYASNIVNSFLESQYRASVLDKIKETPVEELSVLKDSAISDLSSSKIIIK